MTILLQGAGLQVASPIGDPIGDGLRADAVAYWNMNEASGTRTDATVNGLNLATGHQEGGADPGSESGLIDLAAKYIRSDLGYIYHADDPLLRIPAMGALSISLWVKLFSLPEGGFAYDILFKDDNDIYEYGIGYGYNFGDGPSFDWMMSGTPYDLLLPPMAPELNTWYWLLCELDIEHSTASIRTNNGIPATAPIGECPTTPGRFAVGGRIQPNNVCLNMLDGSVDEVGLWRRILSSDERDYLYNSGAGRALFP